MNFRKNMNNKKQSPTDPGDITPMEDIVGSEASNSKIVSQWIVYPRILED